MISRREFVGSLATGLAGIGTRRVRAQEDTERRIVGARTRAAAERATERARVVYNVIDLEERGWLVVGEYPAVGASALGARSDVSYVEPDERVYALAQDTPWGVDRIDADRAGNDGYTGARADVAVLDTGIDADHPDLRDNLGRGKAFVSCEGSDCREPWDDDNSHGTHCAGTVAAVDSGRGVLGTSAGVWLHAVKVLGSDGSGYISDIADGLQWSADRGYDIASMSLGGGKSGSLGDACGYAYDRGVLLVAAAGNSGPCTDCVSYPAAYDEVIAVSATRKDDTLAGFSSTGPEVELAAPGSRIYSTVPGGYETKSGTSMACPHVAGAGAHLMALGYQSVETTTDVSNPGGARGRLRDTAEDIGLSANEGGNGLADVEAAVSDAPTPLGEIGVLEFGQDDRSAWREVSLSGSYTDPVVLAGPVSEDGGHPVHARVRNVSTTGFEIQLEEWEYLDGGHTTERVSYLVCEAGSHELADGRRIDASTTKLDDSGGTVSFGSSFPTRPMVFSTTQTTNGGQPVVTRQASVSTTGFDCRLQEEEALGNHATETVGYLAAEPGADTASGVSLEADRTPNEVTEEPSAIDFAGGYGGRPAFLAAAQTADGPDTAALRYRALDGNGVDVRLEEERSADDETNHTTEAVSYLAVDGAGPLYGYLYGRNTVGETGTLSLDQPDRGTWREVSLDRAYTDPVVLMGPVSENGGQPAHPRVRNVSATSFELQLEEWEYLNGSHTTETVDYVVCEGGSHELANGARIEAGTADFDHRGTRIPFDRSFPDRPVVFSTTQTRNGSQPVVTWQAAVSTTGFDCRLQEEEALGAHVTETVGYLAVEQGAGTAGGIEMEAGRTPDSVTDSPYGIDFTQGYDRTPTVFCAMQTADGSDTATLRTVARDSAGVEVRVEEEESADDETSHITEAVGYLAIGGDRLVGS